MVGTSQKCTNGKHTLPNNGTCAVFWRGGSAKGKWIEIHQDELMADWELASQGQTVFKIEPLK